MSDHQAKSEIQIISEICSKFKSVTVWKHFESAINGDGDFDLSICPTELEKAVEYLINLLSDEHRNAIVYQCRHAENVVQVIKVDNQGMLQIDFSYRPSRFCYNWIRPMTVAKCSFLNKDGIRLPSKVNEVCILAILYLTSGQKKKAKDLVKINYFFNENLVNYREMRKCYNPLISASFLIFQFRVRRRLINLNDGDLILKIALLISSIVSGQIWRFFFVEKGTLCSSRKVIHYHNRQWQNVYSLEEFKNIIAIEEDCGAQV